MSSFANFFRDFSILLKLSLKESVKNSSAEQSSPCYGSWNLGA